MNEDMVFQIVGVGEEPGLVAAYRAAARSAERLRGALVRAGLADAMLFIAPSVSDGGEPVVHVTITVAGALTGRHVVCRRMAACHEVEAALRGIVARVRGRRDTRPRTRAAPGATFMSRATRADRLGGR